MPDTFPNPNVLLDATLVSHAFDAGNYSAAYVSADLDSAWETYSGEEHFAGDAYRDAFVLGFFSSCEAHEIGGDDRDAYDAARESDCGQAVLAAGYCD